MHVYSAFRVTQGVQISLGGNVNLHSAGHAKSLVCVYLNLFHKYEISKFLLDIETHVVIVTLVFVYRTNENQEAAEFIAAVERLVGLHAGDVRLER